MESAKEENKRPAGLYLGCRRTTRRFVKGILLIAWICALIYFAGMAATERASYSVIAFFDPPKNERAAGNQLTPYQHLARYQKQFNYPAPIEPMLNAILSQQSWTGIDIIKNYESTNDDKNTTSSGTSFYSKTDINKKRTIILEWSSNKYNELFHNIHHFLDSLVSNKNLDLDNPRIARPRIPFEFHSGLPKTVKENSSDEIKIINIPNQVLTWIQEERLRVTQEKQRHSLINTFFLLLVLGAFGSVIFLTKDYIERDINTLIAAYIFRPFLGMFLAVAVFLVDILAHSVISTADLLETRHETLYILALAAGMLSEQAYAAVSGRAQAALDRFNAGRDKSASDADKNK